MVIKLIKWGLFKIIVFTFIFSSEQLEFNIGSARHDYSNIDFSYNGREGFLEFKLKKLSLSTMNSNSDISKNRSSIIQFIDSGPSKMLLQGLSIKLHDNYSNNSVKFDLGTMSLDITDFDVGYSVDDYGYNPIPEIDAFNVRFKISNLKLDLSRALNLPADAERMLEEIGIKIDEFSITRGSINTSYNETNNFIFNLDGYTSMANIDAEIRAKINQKNPNQSVFQVCKLVIRNLSDELITAIENMQKNSGIVIPIKNGAITYDMKEILNSGQIFKSPSQHEYDKNEQDMIPEYYEETE